MVVFFLRARAEAVPIRFDAVDPITGDPLFFIDPTVTISADGLTAVFEEDAAFLTVILSNDPGFGDPDAVIPGPNTVVSFDWDFDEGPMPPNDDEFGAFSSTQTLDSVSVRLPSSSLRIRVRVRSASISLPLSELRPWGSNLSSLPSLAIRPSIRY